MLHVALQFVSNQKLEAAFTPTSSPVSIRSPMAVHCFEGTKGDSDACHTSCFKESYLEP